MQPKNKKILIGVIVIAVALNALVFALAYPASFTDYSTEYARDFSAYYIGEWRLFHNPTQIYASGHYQSGDYPISPTAQIFKYTPSFLIFFAPFITLSYYDALGAFDLVQFASVFLLAFFVYKLVKEKNVVLGSVAAVIVLLTPVTFDTGYYWGYVMANAHVIQNTLMVGALYFAYTKKPWFSALLLAIGSFDPRATLLALPLLIWYSRGQLKQFAVGTVGFIAAFNLPFFFYQNIGMTFLQTEVNGFTVSQMYTYDWIPLLSIAALTVVEVVHYLLKKNQKTLLPQKPITSGKLSCLELST